MATAQDGASTEEAGGLVAIVVLAVEATDTAVVTKRECDGTFDRSNFKIQQGTS